MIYFLRHCDKTAKAADAPLSALGVQQAEALVAPLAKLGIERIISSPYLRAQQSALPFAKSAGLPLETNKALAEWRLSEAPRDDWKQVLARGLANPDIAAKGGESAKAVWARAQHVITQTVPTLLVTHGGWLTIALSHFGREASVANLLKIQSPDLFSIGPEGIKQHEF